MRKAAEAPDHLAVADREIEIRLELRPMAQQGLEQCNRPVLLGWGFGMLERQIGEDPLQRFERGIAAAGNKGIGKP